MKQHFPLILFLMAWAFLAGERFGHWATLRSLGGGKLRPGSVTQSGPGVFDLNCDLVSPSGRKFWHGAVTLEIGGVIFDQAPTNGSERKIDL